MDVETVIENTMVHDPISNYEANERQCKTDNM